MCHTCHTGTAEHLDAGRAYLVTVIAINKKGASTAVYQTVETVQQPELQLVEEKIEQEPDIAESGRQTVINIIPESAKTRCYLVSLKKKIVT